LDGKTTEGLVTWIERELFIIDGSYVSPMSPRHITRERPTRIRAPLTGQDRARHRDSHRHHPESSPFPHPPHQSYRKPALPPRHHPHTKPVDLNIDHGTRQNRPQPEKIFSKINKNEFRN